jgi:hypothetical protein
VLFGVSTGGQAEALTLNTGIDIFDGCRIRSEAGFGELHPVPDHPFDPAVAEPGAPALPRAFTITAEILDK